MTRWGTDVEMFNLRSSYMAVFCLLVPGGHTAANQRHPLRVEQQVVGCLAAPLEDSFLAGRAGLAAQSEGAHVPVNQPEPLLAPGKGVIRGAVTDAVGKASPGAKLTATNNETNQSTTVTANECGAYVLILPAGTYSLLVVQPFLKVFRATNIVVKSQEIVNLLIQLRGDNKKRHNRVSLPSGQSSATPPCTPLV